MELGHGKLAPSQRYLRVAQTFESVGVIESAGVIFVKENGEGPGVRLRKAAK